MLDFFKQGYTRLKDAIAEKSSSWKARFLMACRKKDHTLLLEDLERIFYEANLGSELTEYFLQLVENILRKNPDSSPEQILHEVCTIAVQMLQAPTTKKEQHSPLVILVVGANGCGKTTSTAKLAHYHQKQGKSVLLVAADTYRAAAIEQLVGWSSQLKIPIVQGRHGGDPSAAAYEGLHYGIQKNIQTIIIDTAGRLENKKNLMHELTKIRKTLQKMDPSAPQETHLVLDCTQGQNSVLQAELFHEAAPLTGIIATKADQSRKSGVLIAIHKKTKVPIQWLGIGENLDDFIPFDAKLFVESLFS